MPRLEPRRTLRIVGRDHPICRTPLRFQSGIPDRSLKLFLKKLLPCDGAILVFEDGRLVGMFRYSRDRRTLYACGTWVAPSVRRQGLGMKMWRAAMRRHRIKHVEVKTVSRGGHGLIKRLQHKTTATFEEACLAL